MVPVAVDTRRIVQAYTLTLLVTLLVGCTPDSDDDSHAVAQNRVTA